HQFRQAIHFFTRVGPKRNARAVRLMVAVLRKTKEFRWPVTTSSIKRVKIVAWVLVSKPELRQKFSVELPCYLHVPHPQIDVIKATRLHFVILNWFASQFNRA